MAGYSTTPLAKKLGIKSGNKVTIINAPEYYFNLFTDLPEIEVVEQTGTPKDFIHFFTKDARELSAKLPSLKYEITASGIIWVSWPKKASGIMSDVNENLVRDIALNNGLVDIKVCAVDDTWSGLKLVIPVKDRK